ncbi:MAG: hypothetical protein F4W99_01550 [Chloroflexi bacterium]|nr:hypothetical protein [Chloroflexota bacterium]MYJ02467.1 hypothetical protein [Chloroflexota bacterium]
MWRPPDESSRRMLAWFLIGAASAALIGWVLLEVVPQQMQTTRGDVEAIRYEALSEAYDAAYGEAYESALQQRMTYELALLVLASGQSSDSAWAEGVRRGWAEGWNDALDAMFAASIDAGLEANSRELATLAAEPRRDKAP